MEWKKVRLGDIAEITTGKSNVVDAIADGQYPFYDRSDIVKRSNKWLFDRPSAVIVPGESSTFLPKLAHGKFDLHQRAYAIFPKEMANAQYLYYVILNAHWYFAKVATGSTVSSLRLGMFQDMPISLPPIQYQRRIASVLSTLDRKIALNRAINHNLEAMAKQLYDYWFVQFDFPNANGRPYKSSGGEMVWNERLKREIPKGWEVENLKDFTQIKNGATPSTSDNANYGGNIVWITPKDLSDQQSKFVYQGQRNISQQGYDSCSTTLLPKDTVLMSSRAPIGLLSIAKTTLCTNQGFKSLVPNNMANSIYLYYYIQDHIRQIEQLGTGTTFKEVSRDDLCSFPILKAPQSNAYSRWVGFMKAISEKQFTVTKETAALTTQRDTLLPLLMNGQVSVNYDLSHD